MYLFQHPAMPQWTFETTTFHLLLLLVFFMIVNYKDVINAEMANC